MSTYAMVQVDVFTDRPLAGNPLAVFPRATGLSGDGMQAVAGEMNLSETAFVLPPEGDGDARVRIFTPATELPFAGHPSVGTACVLVNEGLVQARGPLIRVVLELGVGPTVVEVEMRGGEAVAATVRQGPPAFGDEIPRAEAAAVLGLDPDDLAPDLEPQTVGTGLTYALIPLRDTGTLSRVRLTTEDLAGFERRYAEVYPWAFTGDDEPWVEARGLFPLCGIPEDPATGSAAGPLAAYLAAAGRLAPGEKRVVLQGRHIGRPSLLAVSVEADGGDIGDVLVAGGVVTVMRATLSLP